MEPALRPVAGAIDVPKGPGLGIEIDSERLAYGLAEATA
jgi:hypothetical protein